ncbi:MAG: ABC transporter permease [Deltaproteobacteria bacterium]|nr:ABC transporter permease [Deltaproteobacteria bacterium]
MNRILAVAQNTFKEAIRNKVLYALLFFAVALIAASLAVAKLSLGNELRVITDLGLAAVSLFSVVIAVFIGVNLVYKELERKTIYQLLSKPLRRHEFIAGRYLGTVATMALLMAFMILFFVGMILLQNGTVRAALCKALWLSFVEVSVISAVALFFSSFSSPFLSGLFTLLAFATGRLTPQIHQLLDQFEQGIGVSLVRVFVATLPDCHLFTVSGAVVGNQWMSIHGQFVTWRYVAQATAYGLLYSLVVLVLAALIFRRRDLV